MALGSLASRQLQPCTRSTCANVGTRRRQLALKSVAPDTNGASVKPAKLKQDPRTKPFTNINKFHVPPNLMQPFEAVIRQREQEMGQHKGFLGLTVDNKNGTVVVQSRWASIPEWEAYSCSPAARRSHLPNGLFQYVPSKGEGFPEDFIPFVEMSRPVDAKY